MEKQSNKIIGASMNNSNMPSYNEARDAFRWKEIEKVFSWHESGRINMAYEAIDRHVASGKGNKIALHYSDNERDEKYTFEEMRNKSNQAANVLKQLGIKKGDRVFIFMPRTPELYFGLLGALKIGAIVGPLFEAFMETAVRDRLEDSGASAIITTADLLSRIPLTELPELKLIILVGEQLEVSEGQFDFNKHLNQASKQLEPEWLDMEDGMILHYTS